ncbi:MAG: hypothetical protein PF542_02320 [Nanoarchaeota archaeon]|jgi:hypothetical protein|nr:hypothetical protein [Nanoarchaeota archaeon]
MTKDSNFKVHRDKDIDKFRYNSVKKGIQQNKTLFGKQLKKINVFICDNEEEFKKHSKYYYFPHGAGTCLRNGDVIVRSVEFLNYPNEYKYYYENLISHEINHSFWRQFYKIPKPLWLDEAIATIIEGRLYYDNENDFYNLQRTKATIKKLNLNESCLKYRYMEKDLDSTEKVRLFYSVWGHFAEFISNKNPRLLIKFMNDYSRNPTKENYHKQFTKHFKDSIKNKFSNFLK